MAKNKLSKSEKKKLKQEKKLRKTMLEGARSRRDAADLALARELAKEGEKHEYANDFQVDKFDVPVVLGRKYRDVVLGIEGIATMVTFHINSCAQVALDFWDHNQNKNVYHMVDYMRLQDVETGEKIKDTVVEGMETPPKDDNELAKTGSTGRGPIMPPSMR